MTYADKLRDPRWQRRRLEIMERDGFACQECKNTRQELNVHHRLYRKGMAPWEYDDCELVTLCRGCHEVRHALMDSFNEMVAWLDSDALRGAISAAGKWISESTCEPTEPPDLEQPLSLSEYIIEETKKRRPLIRAWIELAHIESDFGEVFLRYPAEQSLASDYMQLPTHTQWIETLASEFFGKPTKAVVFLQKSVSERFAEMRAILGAPDAK